MNAPPSYDDVAFRRQLAARAPLYAIVDAARDPEGPLVARQTGVRCESLYAGRMGDLLRNVAPYLIDFAAGAGFRQWWFEERGRAVGILAESAASPWEVRRHLRTLMIVRGKDRARYYFRFYDPRVLRVFLPACTADEVKRFLGPISAFHCEGSRADEILTFTPAPQGVKVETRSIAATAAART